MVLVLDIELTKYARHDPEAADLRRPPIQKAHVCGFRPSDTCPRSIRRVSRSERMRKTGGRGGYPCRDQALGTA
jgi:hypothetical protein